MSAEDHDRPDPAQERRHTSAHAAWERARDLRLGAFLTARMCEVEIVACSEERAALMWVLDILPGWRNACAGHVPAAFVGRVDTVGWILRLVAHSRWRHHPEWEAAFHPQAAGPDPRPESAP
ncbi:hypothetical protein ACGFS9_17000 [Streptomyces sp. NPDC048566]|uniref:hypothetical protein n=1 Tax=Streptomyces sp. NPDC048566 TaxID=3365569 RepID=UPI003715B8D9